jgi:SAM-dependent methyltransferase
MADVINKEYNPKGAFEASEYVFPFNDESFDFVFLGSVFTHMLPQGVERYLSEIARVLKVGGKSLATYFLLTPKTLDSIERGESTLPFTYDGSGFKAVSETLPEMAVAYDESFVRALYDQNSLTITEPIRYGSWPRYVPKDMFGKKVGDFEYQDFVVAQKQPPKKDSLDSSLAHRSETREMLASRPQRLHDIELTLDKPKDAAMR